MILKVTFFVWKKTLESVDSDSPSEHWCWHWRTSACREMHAGVLGMGGMDREHTKFWVCCFQRELSVLGWQELTQRVND